MAKSKEASFSTDQLSPKRKTSLPWHLVLKGAVCGLVVIGILALAAFIPDLQQSTLFGGISTNNFEYEWWTMLGVTIVVLGVAFCGVGVPILLLRGARLRQYIIVFAAEFIVIGAALAIVSGVTSHSNQGDNSGDRICSGLNIAQDTYGACAPSYITPTLN
jgi:hypothetical protein